MTYPILEFDPARAAYIDPAQTLRRLDVPQHCVICFFREVLDAIVATHPVRLLAEHRWEDGVHRFYELEHQGRRLAFFHPGVGAPMSAGLLEEAIALGCGTFIACGGAGVLNKGMAVGHLVVVSAAVRDEGLSYHYLAPSREVQAQPEGVRALSATLEARGLPYVVGKTWTTDAPYRETFGKVARRRDEDGCLTVEMESASLMAVAQFRGVAFGQVLYGGDDLSGEAWDSRAWQSRRDVREQLFWLAADACLAM